MDAELDRCLREIWSQLEFNTSIVENTLGATNHVFRVNSKPAFYLRQYRTDDIKKIQNEHELLLKLSQDLAFVVAPCLTRTHSTIANIQGQYYALFPEAHGRLIEQSELSIIHAFQAGSALANLHNYLAPFSGDKFPTIKLSWDKDAWVTRLNNIINMIESSGVEENVDHWARRRAQQQRHYLAAATTANSYYPKTQTTLIHGDYHHFNVFFDAQSKVSGVIDWDLLQNMPPAYEIARACMYMFKMESKKSVAFIEGYMSESEMSHEMLNDGARAWGIYADHHVWALEEVYLKGSISAQKFIPQSEFKPFIEQWLPIEKALFGATDDEST
ncbi:Homoserine kinase [Marinomonas spartinae]|uniref:phosphotransferase enzyme family protein n=1 Tax=Marinomonas spartinae TaxID=1792290 RepID=UPI000808D058|nr:phosphotransferase [Marinomonas spartinae]SBS26092.1 Homoserine kinase [Marinomonas spartinae]